MLKFTEMPYTRPDMEAAKTLAATLTARLTEAPDYAAAKRNYRISPCKLIFRKKGQDGEIAQSVFALLSIGQYIHYNIVSGTLQTCLEPCAVDGLHIVIAYNSDALCLGGYGLDMLPCPSYQTGCDEHLIAFCGGIDFYSFHYPSISFFLRRPSSRMRTRVS